MAIGLLLFFYLRRFAGEKHSTADTNVQIFKYFLQGLVAIDGFVAQHRIHAFAQALVILIG